MSTAVRKIAKAEAAVEHARLRRDQSVLKLADAEAHLAQLRDEEPKVTASVADGHFEGHDCARQSDDDTSDIRVPEAERALQVVLEFGVDREPVGRAAVSDGTDKFHACAVVERLNGCHDCGEGICDVPAPVSAAKVSLKFSCDRQALFVDLSAEEPFHIHVTSPVVVGGTSTVGDGRVPGIRIEISGTCGKAVAS